MIAVSNEQGRFPSIARDGYSKQIVWRGRDAEESISYRNGDGPVRVSFSEVFVPIPYTLRFAERKRTPSSVGAQNLFFDVHCAILSFA